MEKLRNTLPEKVEVRRAAREGLFWSGTLAAALTSSYWLVYLSA